MASRARLEGAVRLARSYVDASNATFVERELAWAVLRLAAAGKLELPEHSYGNADPLGRYEEVLPPYRTE